MSAKDTCRAFGALGLDNYGRTPLKKPFIAVKLLLMSFSEVIAELPRLTFEERQVLIRQVFELDDPPLSLADEEVVVARLAAHHSDPSSSVSLDEMKRRLR